MSEGSLSNIPVPIDEFLKQLEDVCGLQPFGEDLSNMTERHYRHVYRDALRKLDDRDRTDTDTESLRLDLAELRRGFKSGRVDALNDHSFSQSDLVSVVRTMIAQLKDIESDDIFHRWAEEICDTHEYLNSKDISFLVEIVVRRIRQKSANGFCIAKMCYSIVKLESQIENETTREVAGVICDYLEQETGRQENLIEHIHVLKGLSRFLPQEVRKQIYMSAQRRMENDANPENRTYLVAFLEELERGA